MKPLWPTFYTPPVVPKSNIIDKACARFGVTRADVTGPSRLPRIVAIRSYIAVQLRLERCSYPTIGRLLGGRDHKTAMNLVQGWPRRCAQLGLS